MKLIKENKKYTNEVWSSVMEQYNDLCEEDGEPSFQIINEIYFILVPENRLYKRQLNKLIKPKK